MAELCESAHARFDETNYDNWNDGTYTWALRLVVPVPLFASLEPRLLAIEQEIGAKLAHFGREYPNDHVGEVTITPISPSSVLLGKQMTPSDVEVCRLRSRHRRPCRASTCAHSFLRSWPVVYTPLPHLRDEPARSKRWELVGEAAPSGDWIRSDAARLAVLARFSSSGATPFGAASL